MSIRSLFFTLLPWLALLKGSGATTPLNGINLALGSCTPTVPCATGACCNGQTGLCGFGSAFCSAPVHNCAAVAECGPNAPNGHTKCPLCDCSKDGFCGIGADFCGAGCLSGCTPVAEPSMGCLTLVIYSEVHRLSGCMTYPPEQIAADVLTHINYAYAVIDRAFEIVQMSSGDTALWSRTTALKTSRPGLKVFLTIGGWNFNNPRTSSIFSTLVASMANINTFISSALVVLETYGFDGIDIDWNYPGAPDRGGVAADTSNYAAFGPRGYGLTFTASISYWYLQHFDLSGMLAVLSFDLHGVYDGVDPYLESLRSWFNIGCNIVYSTITVTEIDAGLQLYWRAGVNPSQVVMGMTATDPGCSWVSGGNPGLCSANSGTLMLSEIQSILSNNPSSGPITLNGPIIDPDAAVAYVNYQEDQWVSFDTTDTFAMKMSYAKSHCLGGTMVWSVDQDDPAYSALYGLYPNITDNNVASNPIGCYTTQCGASQCAPGNVVSTTLYSPLEGICSASLPALVCCPLPKSAAECTKRGWVNSATPCEPECLLGETLIAQDVLGNTTSDVCISGNTALCCNTDVPVPSGCTLTACNANPSVLCPSSSGFVTSVSPPGRICPVGTAQALCCPSPFNYSNCAWHGNPPLCDDATCGLGQIALMSDLLGDGSQPCAGSGKRVYCCDPPVVLPTPFSDIFPNGTTQGSELFYVEFDNDVGNASSSKTATHSTFAASSDENTNAFGEIFINSPKQGSVSSMSLASNWVIVNCDAKSDQAQQVEAYCSKPNDSACNHVHIDGAANTVIELPKSCGAGPYARIVSLEVHANQSVLPAEHSALKPISESVFLLHFDYNFMNIPASNGPIYLRADVSDMPGYWDNIVASPPERKRWLEERALAQPFFKRWWGSFTTWLSKINIVKQDLSDRRNFDTLQIFRDSTHCDGPPEIDASLDISLTGSANLGARYGFYLQGTIVPPAVTASYLHFSSDASVSAVATVHGQGSVTYDSSMVTFGTFGFPGLSYPGLITIGPSLLLEGYVNGQLSLAGSLSAGVTYNFPSVYFSLGKTGTDDVSPRVTTTTGTNGSDYDFNYEVELSGAASIHMVPSIQLGISILGGELIDAQAYIRADVSTGVALVGSVSNNQGPQICVIPHFGAILSGGLTGSLLYWEPVEAEWIFYTSDFTFGSKCWSSIQEPSLNAKRSARSISASEGAIPFTKSNVERHKTVEPTERNLLPRDGNNCPIPGILACPNMGAQIGAEDFDKRHLQRHWCNARYVNAIFRRSTIFNTNSSSDTISDPEIHPIVDVTVAQCKKISFKPYAYDRTKVKYFHLANANTLNGITTSPGVRNYIPGIRYAREHVYEMQLIGATKYLANPSSYAVSPLWDIQPKESMINRLKQCVPSNTQSAVADTMPFLESTQNGIKALTAAVAKYLQDSYVQDQFVEGSNCIKDTWIAWQRGYNTDTSVQAPGRTLATANVETIYEGWIKGVVEQVLINLQNGLRDMISLYAISAAASPHRINAASPKEAAEVNAVIDIVNLKAGPTAPVSANTLTTQLAQPLSQLSMGFYISQL
ncbi:hypothetical protein B0H14DRAFT_2817404 [Mycena olivaceomarginata]|nr:hypothetical protein B0H14DRAFT_2817404 [Mycena olivaceomarginata]